MLLADASIKANSFVTVSEANEYFSNRFGSSDWPTENDSKDSLLITASRLISVSYYWKGYKTDYKQLLEFPRFGIYAKDGWYLLDSTTIPDDIKLGTFELAYSMLSKESVESSPIAKGIKKLKLDTMSVEYDESFLLDSKKVSVTDIPYSVSSIFSYMFLSSVSRDSISNVRVDRVL